MLSQKARILLAFGIVGVLVLAGVAYYVGNAPVPSSGTLNVVASFYPYYYFATRVGGSRAVVSNLLPAGVEPHDWEPTPSAIAQVHEADVFVFNGYVESYLESLFAELPADPPVRVNTSAGLPVRTTGNGQVDPHVWLDPILAGRIVDAIEAGFSAADPEGASVYHANAQEVRAELAGTNAVYASGLRVCGLRTFVSQHEAFGYLAARYDLTMIAIQGLSPDAEPTPEQLAEIRDTINATGVQYIFYEELVDPRVAQTLADETGVATMVLSPVEGLTPDGAQAGDTYFSLFSQNLVNLRIALECS
jgi:zinc transport system substrate-binding protein